MGRIETFRDLGCVVTGASAGIGREAARLLAAEGARLVVSARRAQRLAELAEALRAAHGAEVHVVVADLADEKGVDVLVEQAERLLGHVDVLVNNAGFSVPGHFVRSDEARTEAMIRVNVIAATRLFRRLLPGMVRREKGGVLNVASVAGFQAAPFQAAYAGTKAYLKNLSESVYQEVKHTKVAVTTLCPGVTDTEFFDAAGYKNLGRYMKRRMSAERVARAGLDGLRRGRMTVVPGFTNRALIFVQRLVPRGFTASVSRYLMSARKP